MNFFAKMRGAGTSPPRVGAAEIVWSFLGAAGGIGAVAWLHQRVADPAGLTMLLGSFGASAVLLYGAPKSPLAQPRNLIGGHVVSALVGVSVGLAVPGPQWLVCALAVALAIALMHATGTLHPPGGATALIAVSGGPKIAALGYLYVLFPVLSGALVMLAVALVAVNAAPTRRYPEYWL
ncbi:HPP family protein [Desulfovibrio sp. TomC]|uniref:HPP family protein n=1 Tax=Desulfovibrio sp. TomC TaxID=1562888 RepID=UPI000574BEE1|nr:HPP family protein [Desulfovibrio sp. TomC]KHK03246.1 CBS-domain-containing membrane protein [Desulfovibrio sp. TomC]